MGLDIPISQKGLPADQEDSANLAAGRAILEKLRDPFAATSLNNTDYWTAQERSAYIPEADRKALREMLDPLLPDNANVLDLMSGRELSFNKRERRIIALGLVSEVMEANKAAGLINEDRCCDLNATPQIPEFGIRFNAVVNSFGIMYLTKPIEVLRSLVSSLEPSGRLYVIYAENAFHGERCINAWISPQQFCLIDDAIQHISSKEDRCEARPFTTKFALLQYFLGSAGFQVTAHSTHTGIEHRHLVRGINRFEQVNQTNQYHIVTARPIPGNIGAEIEIL